MEIAIIKEKEIATIFSEDDGIDVEIEKVKKLVDDFEHDISTVKSRKESISFAASISTYKVKIDGFAEKSIEKHKIIISKTNKNRKHFRESMDNLRDEARKPVTEWEEQERVRLEEAAAKLKYEDDWSDAHTADELFDLRKEKAEREAIEKKNQEAEAEKERLRLVEVEKKEREEAIAKEAAKEAERKAEKAEQKARQAEQDKINAEKLLEETEKKAEIQKKDAEKAAEKAEEKRIKAENQATEKAEQTKIQAKKDAEIAAEDARLAEIQRQDDEKKRQRIEQEKLEKNRRHVGKIRRRAKENLMSFCKVNEEIAKTVVMAIVKGNIQDVTISYSAKK